MKKVISILMTTFLLLFFIPSQLIAVEDSDNTSVSTVNTVETAKVEALTERLNEIKDMDIPALNSAEKKELRKEVRSIKGELKTISKSDSNSPANSTSPANSEANERGNGVYLSVGAIIIIVLLLILLL